MQVWPLEHCEASRECLEGKVSGRIWRWLAQALDILHHSSLHRKCGTLLLLLCTVHCAVSSVEI